MKIQTSTIFAGVLLGANFLLGGCNVGNAPPGMSGDDAKAAIDRMSPQDKIKAIASSPMPDVEKQKQFAEIEAKTGVKAKDILGNRPVTGGH